MVYRIQHAVLAVWVTALVAVAVGPASASYIHGTVTHHVRGDTLVLDLDLEFQHDLPDTLHVFSQESAKWASLRKPDGEPPVVDLRVVPCDPGAPLRWAGLAGLDHRLVGQLRVALDGRAVPSVLRIEGWSGTLTPKRGPRWRAARVIYPRTLALRIIPLLAFGAYNAELPGTPQRDGLVGGFAAAGDLWWGGERLFLETDLRFNYSDSDPFNFSETISAGWRHHFGSPSARWRPALEVSGGFASLENGRGPYLFNDSGFGGRFGAAVVGPHLSASYAYGTAVGGYHKASVDVWYQSGGLQRYGTRYEVVAGDGFEIFRVGYLVEGLAGHRYDDMFTADHRPWPVKALSLLGLVPLTPIVLFVAIVGPGN